MDQTFIRESIRHALWFVNLFGGGEGEEEETRRVSTQAEESIETSVAILKGKPSAKSCRVNTSWKNWNDNNATKQNKTETEGGGGRGGGGKRKREAEKKEKKKIWRKWEKEAANIFVRKSNDGKWICNFLRETQRERERKSQTNKRVLTFWLLWRRAHGRCRSVW